MVDGNTKIQNILRNYERQSSTTKQLAQLRKAMNQKMPESDKVKLSSQGKREQLVENISKEIMDNLITSKTDNPVVAEIKQELEQEFNTSFLFEFMPKENRTIVRNSNREQLSEMERIQVMDKLWELTKRKVNETMA